MSTPLLDHLLTAVNDYDASDLHLVVGVPPAFRVNGEIILADEDAGESAQTVSARPGWDAIPAVKDGRIYTVNPDIVSRPGPRLIEALETLKKLVYGQ